MWNAKVHGWIYVSPLGYPFYYVVNKNYEGYPGWAGGDCDHEWHIGPAGVNFVIALLGGKAGNFAFSTECVLTDDREAATSLFPEAHIRAELPASDVSRAQRIENIDSSRKIIFYDDTSGRETVTGALAILTGRGAIELNGYAAGMLTEASKAATAFAMYTYKKLFDT